jgi:predicted ATP-dependent Lon-type protease
VKGATLDPSARDNASIAQMPEQVPQRWWGTMQGEAFTTPVPEKLRDDLFIEVLHAAVPSLKPMA